MKKLLNCLVIISIFSSTTTLTISCGTNPNNLNPDDPNWEEKNKIYELFGERFTSKEAAIAFFTNENSGVEINENKTYHNELLLGEQKFSDISKMFQYIETNYPIEEKLTNKNPDNYLMDGMNQLTSEVITDNNEKVTIYKDRNGNAISNIHDNKLAYQEAKETYLQDIEMRYVVNDNEFRTIDDIENYFYEKFLNSSNLKEENLYSMGGNLVYTEEGLRGEIRNSIRSIYNYNGVDFFEDQINDLSVINPTQEEKQKIQRFDPSPGSYLIEATGSDNGQYTGDKIIQSDIDLTDIIRNKEKWVLESSSSSSVKDAAYDFINYCIVSIIGFYNNLMKIGTQSNDEIEEVINNCTEDKPTIINIFSCYGNEQNYDVLESLINKYDLNAQIGAIVQNIVTIQTLSFSEKASIVLYQIQETFRYSNIADNSSDSKKLNDIMYDLLLNLDSTNEEWVNFVEELGTNNSNLGFQYLIEPSTFYQNLDFVSNIEKILNLLEKLTTTSETLTTVSIDKMMVAFTDYISVLELKGINIKAITKLQSTLKHLSTFNLYFGLITTFLDLIPFSNTETYVLHIPNSTKVLKYQITNDWFNHNVFNPADIFNVVELKKPSKNETYFYNNKYYASYNDAYTALQKNIMTSVLKSNNVKYFITQKPDSFFNSKEELIEQLVEYYKENSSPITNRYTDFFGNSYSNEREAYEKMIENIENEQFKKIYKYNYSSSEIGNNVIYANSEAELIAMIEKDLEIESKIASISQLNQGITNFDQIEDLSKFTYKIYSFNMNGMNYYFKDATNATYFIMKLLNFKIF